MGNIQDALKGSLARLGVARQVEAAGVVERATEEIAKIIPREDFEVVSFRSGLLKVKVNSAVVASELNLNRKKITKGIVERILISH